MFCRMFLSTKGCILWKVHCTAAMPLLVALAFIGIAPGVHQGSAALRYLRSICVMCRANKSSVPETALSTSSSARLAANSESGQRVFGQESIVFASTHAHLVPDKYKSQVLRFSSYP
jgi:hypothetical protein